MQGAQTLAVQGWEKKGGRPPREGGASLLVRVSAVLCMNTRGRPCKRAAGLAGWQDEQLPGRGREGPAGLISGPACPLAGALTRVARAAAPRPHAPERARAAPCRRWRCASRSCPPRGTWSGRAAPPWCSRRTRRLQAARWGGGGGGRWRRWEPIKSSDGGAAPAWQPAHLMETATEDRRHGRRSNGSLIL